MSKLFTVAQNDLSPNLRGTVTNGDDAPVDLTGCTVVFRMKLDGGSARKINDKPATILDAPKGLVEYAWSAGDTDTKGLYSARFVVVFPGNRQESVPNYGAITVIVSDPL